MDDLAGLLRRAFGESYTIDVQHDDEPAPKVEVARMEQVLLNLLVNARDAQPGGGRMLVRTTGSDDTRVVLEVEDDGPGVPSDIESRIFETYFTTKPKGQGSGLGLSTVRLLVDEVGGEVTLGSSSQGARFRVEMPLEATG